MTKSLQLGTKALRKYTGRAFAKEASAAGMQTIAQGRKHRGVGWEGWASAHRVRISSTVMPSSGCARGEDMVSPPPMQVGQGELRLPAGGSAPSCS